MTLTLEEKEIHRKATECSGNVVFVTVGSTHFEALIEACDTAAFVRAAARHGITYLVMQYGPQGMYEPSKAAEEGRRIGVQVDSIRMLHSVEPVLNAARLVVGHGGTGTILDVLRLGKPLLAVVNPQLMGNHQRELVDELVRTGALWEAEPKHVADRLDSLLSSAACPHWPPAQTSQLVLELDKEVGWEKSN